MTDQQRCLEMFIGIADQCGSSECILREHLKIKNEQCIAMDGDFQAHGILDGIWGLCMILTCNEADLFLHSTVKIGGHYALAILCGSWDVLANKLEQYLMTIHDDN